MSGAQQIFLENSFHGTPLDTLLGSIKVSKGSFFHHFRSKDDLLLQLIDIEASAMFGKLEEVSQKNINPLAALNDFLNWRLSNYHSTGRLIYKLGAEVGNENVIIQKKIKKIYGEYLSSIIRFLDDAKRKRLIVLTTNTKELANFIMYALEGGTMAISLTDNIAQYEGVVEMIKKVIRSYRLIEY